MSTNAGTTWTATDSPSNDWYCVSSSADGTKLAAGGGFLVRCPIFISTNSGVGWTKSSAAIEEWSALACSADGSKLVAVASGIKGGPICISADSGMTWRKSSAPTTNWVSVASSSDGTRLVAAVGYYTGLHGPIFVSVDSGLTWKASSAPIEAWTSVASSADGTTLVAAAGGYLGSGLVCRSIDSGATWISVYSEQQLNQARASDAEMKDISLTKVQAVRESLNSDASWSSEDLKLARQSRPTTISFTTPDGQVITDAEVISVMEGVSVTWRKGASGGVVKLANLPDDLRRRFGYDPAKAAYAEEVEKAKRRQNQAEQSASIGSSFQSLDSGYSSAGSGSSGGSVYVHGYYRQNGTYVGGYTRRR